MSMQDIRKAARSGKLKCPVCDQPRMLIEHHLWGRDIPEKNKLWNRCWICPSCHDEVHSGRIILEGWALTSDGKNLIWHRAGDTTIVNNGAVTPIYGKK